MRRVRYSALPTERPNRASRDLDRLSPLAVIDLMNREDVRVPASVGRVKRAVARAVELISLSLAAGGRLVFVGAGTSGRLGVMEAAECPPTFNTPPALVQAIMAGGRKSVFRSREGAEDRTGEAKQEIRRRVRTGDVVVGIAASGVTPFVRAALAEARRKRAATVLIAMNVRSPLRSLATVLIAPRVGPEILTGSTRLKAGSATKMILNMLTTASMARLGKIYRNLMVDLRPSSRKLRARAHRLIEAIGEVSPAGARRCLRASGDQTKTAIVMARFGVSAREARRRLAEARGSLRRCLEQAY
jgi:N-acetylmuramic acid 6-phosphate etherase